tara:strand:+ start:1561 stop:2505 length:945 start_codon:yes stop_codon:yes gene_type:complete
MPNLFFRKKVLLVETESTYGVDPTPVAADAIVTSNLSITPYDGPTVQKVIDRPSLGNYESVNVSPRVVVSFDVYLAGSGAAGTAPNYSKALLACGLAETVTPSTEVEYDPISDSFDSATLYFYHDGNRHIVAGARGNVAINMAAGELPKLTFTFTGRYLDPTATTLISGAPVNEGDVVAITNQNTPTFSLFGYAAAAFVSLNIDLANQVAVENIPNLNEIFISDRAPAGTVVFLEEDIGSQDWYAATRSDNGVTTGVLSLIHGTAAGGIIEIDAPAIQLSNPQKGERNSLSTLSFDLALLPTVADNDELKLTIR